MCKASEYDQYQRISRVTATVDGQSYVYEYDYNANDQRTVITYPSGYVARKIYNNEGFLIRVEDAQNNTIFYELPEKNAYGQLSSYKLGNGKTTVNTYTDQRFPGYYFDFL